MSEIRRTVPMPAHFKGVQGAVRGKGISIEQVHEKNPLIYPRLHREGNAVLFRVCFSACRYSKVIIALNACNEYFKHRHRLKYRLGYYYEEDVFHLDAVQERMFWVVREGKRKIRRDIPLFLMDVWGD